MALRVKWQSRTLAVRDAIKWAGTVAAAGPAVDGWGAGAAWNSGVLMAGLLPRGGREALGDDLAEHYQDFPTPRWRKPRPEAGRGPGRRRGLGARGGAGGRRVRDMVALRSARRGVPGTPAPAA